ncbi:acyl transferase/acyl hydrolase/lysophospholipase [Apiosordaria backusii]|uniref:Patatin-like phospholipase domain-containing protein n=1 Tax=Apiosordaria backusii TaxID=314023 RepID=A0AA40EI44_9PEZI|nr:acyl transferase/acyl hydrolase/lysophospholipase [Apiosordaria backusii]
MAGKSRNDKDATATTPILDESSSGSSSENEPNSKPPPNTTTTTTTTATVRPDIILPSKTYGFPPEAFDWSNLPDAETNFLPAEHLEAFIQALSAPDFVDREGEGQSVRLNSPGVLSRSGSNLDFFDSGGQSHEKSVQHEHQQPTGTFITARNDWAPVNERVLRDHPYDGVAGGGGKRKRKTRLGGGRSKDETREGHLYALLKWPFLLIVGTWLLGLSFAYLATRSYIYLYEQFIAWRGKREKLRRAMRATGNYKQWVAAARKMDEYFGVAEKWKEQDEFAYYDAKTVKRVWEEMRRSREGAEKARVVGDEKRGREAVEDLKQLMGACIKNNFVGVENPRLYSQTYYGTKNLVQNFVDEVERSMKFLLDTELMSKEEKRGLFKGISANYGRTALCLSGGATFAYYHFGVVKALLEEDKLPDIITGTSGGALVAALVATRTNEELKELLVPALAHKITACSEPITVWFKRWWKTGARFDSVDWAQQCSWWARGSMTFKEAYERTGRVLNVSCVPADPHSPTILCNYLTSPDCVIWSAVLASAAVPGILNPVVLMMKTKEGKLVPYSFGHKWKDGSLRTDIPIKALNLHFNVNFTIVSQVNPHINLFFFSSRGSVGQPVTHRRGRGWRGGYLGSAVEQYIKLDLTKWLRVLRQLELLPRPLGQDWSMLWLQTFGGTVTIWPNAKITDFLGILSDPDEAKLARMIHEGQQSAFPKIKFVGNRLRVERLVERGRRENRPGYDASAANDEGKTVLERRGSIDSWLSDDDLKRVLDRQDRARRRGNNGNLTATEDETTDVDGGLTDGETMPLGGGQMNMNTDGGDTEEDFQSGRRAAEKSLL